MNFRPVTNTQDALRPSIGTRFIASLAWGGVSVHLLNHYPLNPLTSIVAPIEVRL